MKQLIVNRDNRRIKSEKDIKSFEQKLDLKMPGELRNFFLLYEGLYLDEKESYFKVSSDLFFEINKIIFLFNGESGASAEAILAGHKEEGLKGFIPFAIDSGGWDYCFSINPGTYGQVWVDRFDSGEEDPMEFVTDSFEDFIDGLGPEI